VRLRKLNQNNWPAIGEVLECAVLKLLRPEQGVGEVGKQPGGDDAGEPIIEDHGCLLEPVAGDGVANGQRKKAEPNSEQDQVQHLVLLLAKQ
jgi:hypothetical protein